MSSHASESRLMCNGPAQNVSMRQMLFVHVQKTAGTSLAAVLKQHLPNAYDLPPWRFLPDQWVPLNGYDLLVGHVHFELYRLLPERPLFVTMLRDPVERALSAYAQYWRSAADPSASRMDIRQFVAHPAWRNAISNIQVRMIGTPLPLPLGHPDDIRQMPDFPFEPDAQAAIGRLRNYQFFGLVEDMERSMALLNQTFGWPTIELPRLNESEKRIQRHELPPDVLADIIQLNQLDTALYEFAVVEFGRRCKQLLPPSDLSNATSARPTACPWAQHRKPQPLCHPSAVRFCSLSHR